MKTKIPYIFSAIILIPLFVLFCFFDNPAGRTGASFMNIFYAAPGWLTPVLLVLSVVAVVLFIILLINEKTEDTGIRKQNNNVLLRYAFFMIVVALLQLFGANIIRNLPFELSPTTKSTLSFIMVAVSVDLIGFPLLFLLLKKVPSTPVTKQKIKFPQYLCYMLMSAGVVLVGAIAGAAVHTIICAPFGGASIELQKMLMDSAPLPRILVAGILAPIFEELIFRKLLIDRINKYGAFFAIMVSGLTFGLFHGNFQQVFFATLLGFLFAHLYLKTGRVELTIGLHMMVNLATTVVTNTLLQKIYAVNPNLDSSAEYLTAHPEVATYFGLLGLWIMALGAVCVAGIIVLIVFLATKKFVLAKKDAEPSKSEALKAFFTGKYSILFFLIITGLFLLSYLPVVLHMQ